MEKKVLLLQSNNMRIKNKKKLLRVMLFKKSMKKLNLWLVNASHCKCS